MPGIIVSAFVGTGKTRAAKKFKSIIDLESSDYQWIRPINPINKELAKGSYSNKHPKWPMNYIAAIKDNVNKYDIVFISMDVTVRHILDRNNIHYYVCIPSIDRKQEIIFGLMNRRNTDEFISYIDTNYERWINEAINRYKSNLIILKKNKYIEDILKIGIRFDNLN